MRLRIAGVATDIDLTGTVWDASICSPGWRGPTCDPSSRGRGGQGIRGLADEMIRRCLTPPCEGQCWVVGHREGEREMQGCTCSAGWQYTDDNHVQALEKCPPNDVWSDARALLLHHREIGRGDNDPILCDCDDLTAICTACAVYSAWQVGGSTVVDGRPVDPGTEIHVAITRPPAANMAHAYTALEPSADRRNRRSRCGASGCSIRRDAGECGVRRPTFIDRGTWRCSRSASVICSEVRR